MNMKRIAVMIMSVMMVMSQMMVTAFAANDSITVNGAKPGETYKAYKMFDLKVNDADDPTAYSYKVNSDWADFFGTGGAGAQYVTIDQSGYVTAISDAAALAKAAAAWTGKPDPAKTVKVAEGETTAVFSGLGNGYWLITATLGTSAMAETTPDKNAVTVNEKNPEDSVEKKVKEDATGEFADSNDAQVGDEIEYQSTVRIVKGTRNVIVHDKMTSGLTFKTGSVAIEGLTAGTEYTVDESPEDGDTFDISFDQEWIDGLDFGTEGYKEYVITYKAVVNADAVVKGDDGVAIVDQNNKTHVSFGDGTKSEEDSTSTTTHKFSVFKHATGKSDNLAGAVFELKKAGTVLKLTKLDDNNYKVDPDGTLTTFTTVKNGDIVIWGVDADSDYTLHETEAPEGYNELAGEVSVTVDKGNATRADVENKAGTELPSTGGMGTTVIYIAGAALIVICGAMLVLKKRSSK